WALLAAVVLVVGFGIGYSLLRVARPPHGAAMASFDPAAISLSGVQLAQIAIGVLGVLLITSEYATGLIRTTFAAVPRRLPMLWAKAALLAAAIMAVSLPAMMARSEEHTSELQSLTNLVCPLLLEKKKKQHQKQLAGTAPRNC